MRLLSVSAAALLILGAVTPALASQTPGAAPRTQPQASAPAPTVMRADTGPRAVMICDTDAATRAAYTRDFGAPPVFISARQAVDVRQTRDAWTTPRCMTASEHARYVSLTRSIAAR